MLAPRCERQSASVLQEPAEGAFGFDERRTHDVGHLVQCLGQVGADAQTAKSSRWPSRAVAPPAEWTGGLRWPYPAFSDRVGLRMKPRG